MPSEDKSLQTSDGVNIFYNIHRNSGHEKKPFLIFLHGLGGDLTAWNEERDYFHKHHYSTLAIDLRGHGLSERVKGHKMYTFPKLANDMLEVLKKEGVVKPIIVGHCLGGVVSIYLEAMHSVAEKLVLIGTGYKPPYISSVVSDHAIIKRLFRIIAHHAPTLHISSHRDFAKYKGTGDYNARRVLSDLTHTSIRTHFLSFLLVMSIDAGDLVKKIRVPTLVVGGSEDSIFPVDVAKALSKKISGSKFVIIPRANHVVIINNPVKLAKIVEGFLGE